MKQTDFLENAVKQQDKPLAARMAPRNFEEFMGQDSICREW
jgi:replication-associated recombination protein RarA